MVHIIENLCTEQTFTCLDYTVDYYKNVDLLIQNIFTATTRRVRPGQQDTKTSKRRQSSTTVTRRKNSTSRRGSQHHEVQVAMLPDLSGNCEF